jgi:CheY-like chemotaxis protein
MSEGSAVATRDAPLRGAAAIFAKSSSSYLAFVKFVPSKENRNRLSGEAMNGLAKVKVLIVDDVAFIRDLLRTLLGAVGVREFAMAEDGGQGLATVYSWNPDVIFADWAMSPVDGLEFVHSIRTGGLAPNPFVPVILLTAHTERERVMQARDAGITEFLAKPFTAEAVVSRLKAAINQPRDFVRTPVYFGPDRRRRAAAIDEERRSASAKGG